MNYPRVTRALCGLMILAAILATGCSRPRLSLEPQAKASADATLRLGQNLEQRHNFLDAAQTYDSALAQYRAFADSPGQMYALAGLARIKYLQSDTAAFTEYREQMQILATKVDPETQCILDLLDIYILHHQGRYEEILKLATDNFNYPLGIRMQVLTYRLQADSYLNPGMDSQTSKNLESLSGKYKSRLKTDFVADPIVLASAYYALAYNYFLQERYPQALKNIDAVLTWDYRYENFPGLGYAYWLKGQIVAKQGDKPQAISNLYKAREIFISYANDTMLNKTDQLLKALEVTP